MRCPSRLKVRRATLAALAYATSLLGTVGGGAVVVGSFIDTASGWALPAVAAWALAWFSHAVMTVGWIRDQRLPRGWPVTGFASAVLALGLQGMVHSAWQPVLAGVAFNLPCIVLAIRLMAFHGLGRDPA